MENQQLEPTLIALALLGQASSEKLAALLADFFVPFDRARVVNEPCVCQEAGEWRMADAVAAALLTTLEQKDPVAYQQWHERGLKHLAEALRQGDSTQEARFIALLDRLVTHLAYHDPKILETIIQTIQDVPLVTLAGQQNRRYFVGFTLWRLDRSQEALDCFDALLAEDALAPQVRGRALNVRAHCHSMLGHLEAAVEGYRASLQLWRQLGDQLNEGKALHNLGIEAYQLQQYEEAENNLMAAERCFQATNAVQWIGAVQNELGLVYRDQGRWADALHYFKASAEQNRLEGANDGLGIELLNIGEVLLFQGQLAEAEASLREALQTMSTRTYAVDVYLSLGLVHQASGDLTGAQAAYQAALACAQEIERRDILAEVYFRLGEAWRLQGADEVALAQFEAAVQVVESTREPIQDEGLKISLLGRWQQIYEALVLHCLHMQQTARAWHWAEQARARAFAEQLRTPQLPLPDTDAGAQPQLAELQAALPADALLLNYFTTGVLDNHIPLLRMLKKDNPLREHLLTPARTLVFALDQEQLTVHVCLIDPNAFASASRRPEDQSRFLAPKLLTQLYKMLLPEALDLPARRRLYLVPHGPLHYIPFAALTDSAGQPLLHEGGPELVYAPSATIWHQQRHQSQTAALADIKMLAVGYDGAAEGWLLRHTENEARLIAEVTAGEAWTGAAPKKAQLPARAATCRWLHFACHGWFDYEKPLASYLQTGADERLTAQEVLETWQLQAELVVLSACQSGVHRVLRGDEPMGLIRGFLSAGAQAVLASRWPLEDLPTFLLMRYFYHQLVAGKTSDPATALQAAQLWLRALSSEALSTLVAPADVVAALAQADDQAQPFAHARFWAGFVLFGQ